MDFLPHIFNLSFLSEKHLLLFPSIKWESFSNLPLSSGLSLSRPASQSLLNASFYRVYFYSILSPFQAGFLPGRSTLDQILFLFYSILNRLNKPKPGFRTIRLLSTIDFSKAFDSVWFPTLIHKIISACRHPCFGR